MKPYRLLLISAAAVLLLTSACARQKKVVKARLSVESVPSDASVHLLGAERGKTPFSCRLNGGSYMVKITKSGFNPCWLPVSLKQGEEKKLPVVKLTPVKSCVLLESVPSGTQITFRGSVVGNTPLILRDLPFGSYSAYLKSPEYAGKQVTWTIDSPRPKQLRVTLASNMGALLAESEPSGAAVYINKKRVGITPYRVRLEQGTYQVRLDRSGFEPVMETVGVTKGGLAKVHHKLAQKPANLTIRCNPSSATISVNGRRYGKSPITLNGISAGKYTILAEQKGYDSATTVVNVAPGQNVPIQLDLVYNLGSLEFVTSPAGVKVYLNDSFVGETKPDQVSENISAPFRIPNLQPGSYRLRFVHKRAKPSKVERKCVVEKGKDTRLPKTVEMWIANAIIYLKSGTKLEGRLTAELANGDVQFEMYRGISEVYKKNEIDRIVRIRIQE